MLYVGTQENKYVQRGKLFLWEKKDANKLPQQESKLNLFEDYI